MSLIALKFLAAGFIAVGLLFLSMALGAGWSFITNPRRTVSGPLRLSQKETAVRIINDHKVNPANDLLTIEVLDAPGAGGASHEYRIKGPVELDRQIGVNISFQNGPISENGVNGVTQEALLAIVIDRLRAFQAGKFACRENAIALTKIEEAQHWLLHRTRARMARGVEGTHSI